MDFTSGPPSFNGPGPQWSNGQNLYVPQRMQNELVTLNDVIETDSDLRIEWRNFTSTYHHALSH